MGLALTSLFEMVVNTLQTNPRDEAEQIGTSRSATRLCPSLRQTLSTDAAV
jgi:hypothetical protein